MRNRVAQRGTERGEIVAAERLRGLLRADERVADIEVLADLRSHVEPLMQVRPGGQRVDLAMKRVRLRHEAPQQEPDRAGRLRRRVDRVAGDERLDLRRE